MGRVRPEISAGKLKIDQDGLKIRYIRANKITKVPAQILITAKIYKKVFPNIIAMASVDNVDTLTLTSSMHHGLVWLVKNRRTAQHISQIESQHIHI